MLSQCFSSSAFRVLLVTTLATDITRGDSFSDTLSPIFPLLCTPRYTAWFSWARLWNRAFQFRFRTEAQKSDGKCRPWGPGYLGGGATWRQLHRSQPLQQCGCWWFPSLFPPITSIYVAISFIVQPLCARMRLIHLLAVQPSLSSPPLPISFLKLVCVLLHHESQLHPATETPSAITAPSGCRRSGWARWGHPG